MSVIATMTKKKMPVLYPFGHGLSYTTFVYKDLELDEDEFEEEDVLTLRCTVTNTGSYAGAEVVQLYIAAPGVQEDRAPKELKGFCKVFLNPGESKKFLSALMPEVFHIIALRKKTGSANRVCTESLSVLHRRTSALKGKLRYVRVSSCV